MFKYQGVACPHCGKEFQETDQILICPECGAPYHRACIQELGKCMFDDLHQKGESWHPPQKTPHEEEETRYDGRAAMRCSRCGTLNSPDRLFCEVCGTPLNREQPDSSEPNSNSQNQWNNEQWNNGQQQPFHQMAYNPYTTPFGGLSPDEEIDGIPVKDLALYVGQNTHYFLPKFKEMATRGKNAGWNWAAFFLNAYYFFYRKMWLPGILFAVFSILLYIPNVILMYSDLLLNLGFAVPFSNNFLMAMNSLSNIFYILSLVLNLLAAIFANYLYKRKVFHDVDALRTSHGEQQDYSIALTAKGGVSLKGVILFIVVSFALSFFLSFIILSMTSMLL